MAEILKQLSDGLARLTEASAASVVRVEARRRGPSSGVVYADGVVVTASHTVEWDDEIAIGLPDGGSAAAKIAGRDPGTDLAALRVEQPGLRPAPWGDPGDLTAGHLVLAVSRPGRRARANLGLVSVRGEAWHTPSGGRLDHDIRLDLGLHPGFSGSLLVDMDGRALGVGTGGLLRGTPVLVPAATIRRVVDSLLAHGHVRRAFLGIGTQGVQLPAELQKTVGQPSALLVFSLQPGSAAAQAGLLLGDVIAAFDGQRLRHPGELFPLLDEARIGTEAVLTVARAGQVMEIRVTVGSREDDDS